MAVPRCRKCDSDMVLTDQFRFDHEPEDTEEMTARLQRFAALGIDLGAEVTLYTCHTCGRAEARFRYPEPE